MSLRPLLGLQRKAAIARGGAYDHTGTVWVAPKPMFDMNRTIFGTMPGTLPRMVMKDKIAKDVYWSDGAIREHQDAFDALERKGSLPNLDPNLVEFMTQECTFSMEHADGSFLEHLYFSYLYAALYFPEHSANVALLHSILGTATNTFAMSASKIPMLFERLSPFERTHVELFPTVLRLLYNQQLLEQLRNNLHRLGDLRSLMCHRVIDNAPLTVDAESLWIQLNYHLMHFVDFMPAANWSVHTSDPLMQQFQELSEFLDAAKQRRAQVEVEFPKAASTRLGETRTPTSYLSAVLPKRLTRHLAKQSIRRYSQAIGHNLAFQLTFA